MSASPSSNCCDHPGTDEPDGPGADRSPFNLKIRGGTCFESRLKVGIREHREGRKDQDAGGVPFLVSRLRLPVLPNTRACGVRITLQATVNQSRDRNGIIASSTISKSASRQPARRADACPS